MILFYNGLHSILGLEHSQNMKKMRLLTFMQLAEKSSEIAFETIQKELNIGEADVESFIIDGRISSNLTASRKLRVSFVFLFIPCLFSPENEVGQSKDGPDSKKSSHIQYDASYFWTRSVATITRCTTELESEFEFDRRINENVGIAATEE